MEQYKLSFQTETEAAALVSEKVKEVKNTVNVEDGDCQEGVNPYKRDNWGRGAEFLFSCIGELNKNPQHLRVLMTQFVFYVTFSQR